MKSIHYFVLLLIIMLIFATCMSCSSQSETKTVTLNVPLSTATAILTSTPTRTQPSPTLESTQANNAIRTLLGKSTDCLAPCFWGIIPGQTTLDEAQKIFNYFGLQTRSTTQDNNEFAATSYELESGLSVRIILTIKDGIVKDLRVSITPSEDETIATREWLAYSPEMLIKQYGSPSAVKLWVGRGPGPDAYSMEMYFDEVDLIVQYTSPVLTYDDENESWSICPLTDPFSSVRIWLGKDPEYPPGGGTTLDVATSMTLDEFTQLMLGNPENACFSLILEAMP